MDTGFEVVRCPKCESDEFVQKASAIYLAGTTEGYFQGKTVGTTYSGGESGFYSGTSSMSGVSQTNLASLLQMPIEPERPTYLTWPQFYFLGAITIGIVWIIGLSRGWKIGGDEDEIVANYRAQKASWKVALERWNRLYYCHKHSIVIDPMNQINFDLIKTQDYLYGNLLVETTTQEKSQES